nr:TetR/AcrR family transcriptional regulator [Kibdelosporangium phytohabitans]
MVTREGFEGASLRNVADEAGLAIGSVRHYFADHEELMIFTMRELGQRIGARVATHVGKLMSDAPDVDRRTLVEALFAEFLPLDSTRTEEAVAWLAFVVAARTRPALRPTAEEQNQHMRALISRILREAVARGGLPAELDIEVETLRLSALLDGLTLQAVVYPRSTTPESLVAALRTSVAALAGRGQRGCTSD